MILLLVITNASPVQPQADAREYPSVFQAWNPADNLPVENAEVTAARHDLLFHAPEYFGLQWNNAKPGIADGFTASSIENALKKRQRLLALNPNMILLAEIRYRDAHISYLPTGHKFWQYDNNGNMIPGWAEGNYYMLNYPNAEFQAQVAKQCKAAIASGVLDGVMLDWWTDDQDRVALVKKIREQIGATGLIIANSNDLQIPNTKAYINGLFMECYRTNTVQDWNRIKTTLIWAESNLLAPRINCLETWYHTSRNDLNLMRATTTLALTCSNGYCLFSDPNTLSTPDHLHNWYPFWNKSLGKPAGTFVVQADKSIHRKYDKGTAVYNPMGNQQVTVSFTQNHKSVATGKWAKQHPVRAFDGDIFLADTGSSGIKSNPVQRAGFEIITDRNADLFRIALHAPGSIRVSAYDTRGRTVFLYSKANAGAGIHEISTTSEHSPGICIVSIDVNGTRVVYKAIHTPRF